MSLENSSESRKEDEAAIAYLRSKWGEEKFNQFYNNLDLDKLLRYGARLRRREENYRDFYDDYTPEQIQQAEYNIKFGAYHAWAAKRISFFKATKIVLWETFHRRTRGLRKILWRTHDFIADRLDPL